MKKFIYITFFFILFFPILANANTYDYVIDSYSIDMIVNEDNSYDITEVIDVYFYTYKHGIYRTIPTTNKITRLDGSTYTTKAKISKVNINEKYNELYVITNGISYKEYQIGDENKTIIGEKQYIIKYTYKIKDDGTEEYDELYFNLIGSEWDDTQISNVKFKVTLPKEFDVSKIGFSEGVVGSTTSNNVYYTVNGNTIEGNYFNTLEEGEALTIRIELPEGYFIKTTNYNLLFMIIIPLILLVVGIILWVKYGKDERVIETVEFYPPNDINSLELAFLKKGRVNNKDIISLIVYLANKGYIKIEERESDSLFGTEKTFTLIKIKEYDGKDDIEREFFEGLFAEKSEVTPLDLTNFYQTINSITKKCNAKKNKYKIFEKYSLTKAKYLIIMAIISFLVITIPPIIEINVAMIAILLFPIIGLYVVYFMLTGDNGIFGKIFALVWGSVFAGIPLLLIISFSISVDANYLLTYLIGFPIIVILLLLYKNMEKRNEYGNQMLGKINGFETFLKNVEKDKLEELVNQKPTYFFDILPFTYVLNISDKWINKFENIPLECPDYFTSDSFDINDFGNVMTNTINSVSASSSNSSSDGGSSGSSGGGSSGGGSGGGGGGSW